MIINFTMIMTSSFEFKHYNFVLRIDGQTDNTLNDYFSRGCSHVRWMRLQTRLFH